MVEEHGFAFQPFNSRLEGVNSIALTFTDVIKKNESTDKIDVSTKDNDFEIHFIISSLFP